MPEEIKNNDLAKENLIENKVREFFQKTKLNEEQIKRITKCLKKIRNKIKEFKNNWRMNKSNRKRNKRNWK